MKNDVIGNISEQTLTAQTLGDLVRRSLEGDREAFGQIVRQYKGLVSGVTFGLTGDYHKSEDLAQETFIVAWKKLGELRDLPKLPHWLCGIARNLVRNERSRNASKPGTVHGTDAEKLVGVSDDPIDHAIREERNRLVGDALLKIPEKYRLPLVMSLRSGMTTPEIAATLEISEATFYQRISRAKKYLRTELEKQVEGAIRSTGPGDFFSLGVLAALPVAVMSTGCKATAASTTASAAVAEPLIATVCTPEKCGPGASGFLSWSFLLSVGSVLSVVFFWLSWVIGLLPGIWLSVRNAPTLRTRRYLILCSLRRHFLFMAVRTCPEITFTTAR